MPLAAWFDTSTAQDLLLLFFRTPKLNCETECVKLSLSLAPVLKGGDLPLSPSAVSLSQASITATISFQKENGSHMDFVYCEKP